MKIINLKIYFLSRGKNWWQQCVVSLACYVSTFFSIFFCRVVILKVLSWCVGKLNFKCFFHSVFHFFSFIRVWYFFLVGVGRCRKITWLISVGIDANWLLTDIQRLKSTFWVWKKTRKWRRLRMDSEVFSWKEKWLIPQKNPDQWIIPISARLFTATKKKHVQGKNTLESNKIVFTKPTWSFFFIAH